MILFQFQKQYECAFNKLAPQIMTGINEWDALAGPDAEQSVAGPNVAQVCQHLLSQANKDSMCDQ